MVKGQGKKVQNLEAELLETAKRVSKKANKLGTAMTYKDQDEKLLRDKLVNRLKEKEVLKMEHFGERLKNAKENNYFDSSDDGVEDISEEDLDQVEEYGDEFKGKDEEDLRLTSTDDEDKFKDISDDDDYKEEGNKDDANGMAHVGRKIKTESCEEANHRGPSKLEDRHQENGNSKEAYLYDDLPEPVKQEPDDDGGSDDTTTKSKKKKKKEKKEKKKKKKKDKEREEKDESRRKKRELASQICLAKKIAEKDKREKRSGQDSDGNQDREQDGRNIRGRGPDRYNDRRMGSREGNEKDGYPNYREKMLEKRREAARQEAKEKKASLLLQQKRVEQAKDEVYDQLVKGGGSTTTSSDKMRKLRKGEHYEDAQREFLENEIRIRERREKYGSTGITSGRRVDFSNRGGAADFVDSRYHFAGRERSRSSNRNDSQDFRYDRRLPRHQHYDRR